MRLTPAGRKRFAQIEKSFKEFADVMCAGLTGSERETLRNLLLKVSEQIDKNECSDC